MKQDIVYFELNNWFSGRDYPNEEPFKSWMGNDINLRFSNDEWVRENKLCVYESNVDMSINFCITATRKWVMENCPKLLSTDIGVITTQISDNNGEWESVQEVWSYRKFLRFPDEDGEVYGKFGCPFLEYSEENIGVHWWEDDE